MTDKLTEDEIFKAVEGLGAIALRRVIEIAFKELDPGVVLDQAMNHCEGFTRKVQTAVTDGDIAIELAQPDPKLPEGFERDAEYLAELIVAGDGREAIDLLSRMVDGGTIRPFDHIERMLAARNAPAKGPSTTAAAGSRIAQAEDQSQSKRRGI